MSFLNAGSAGTSLTRTNLQGSSQQVGEEQTSTRAVTGAQAHSVGLGNMPHPQAGSYLTVTLFTYRLEHEVGIRWRCLVSNSRGRCSFLGWLTCSVPQDEFIARIAAGVTRLDSEGQRFIPGWQWSHMVRIDAERLQAISSFTSEEASNVPGHAQEELKIVLGHVKGHLQNCLAEPLVRRSGTIRNFVQGPEYEEDLHLFGSARFVTTHMLGIKEGGESGIDAMVVSSMQKLDSTIFQTPGVVCMFYFKAQEVNNCLVLVTEYTSAQDAYSAASRFNLLLNEIAPFIMDPVADNTSLVEGEICV
jgi:hypothetical protein